MERNLDCLRQNSAIRRVDTYSPHDAESGNKRPITDNKVLTEAGHVKQREKKSHILHLDHVGQVVQVGRRASAQAKNKLKRGLVQDNPTNTNRNKATLVHTTILAHTCARLSDEHHLMPGKPRTTHTILNWPGTYKRKGDDISGTLQITLYECQVEDGHEGRRVTAE
ncbi:hypothetical protein EVAR_90818_1 [Eumeta japonica]|uniref:Uncharacterized protein n=1 Tax=Eumeta variegata TaxID=151549 RepID=A0A4C1S8W0_EUMVA|nr:hypothetical protein EVAR_90818_1 [Eumeta japonica]